MKLIVDFDSFIYRACYAAKTMVELKPMIYVQAYDLNKGFEYFKNVMDTMMKATACNEYVLCLSDWRNFRKQVVPTYKQNRKDSKTPEFFDELKAMVYERFDVISRPWLEADDLCRYTYEQDPKNSIIASIDKDLATFPCKLHNPDHPEWGVRKIDERGAFLNFAKQLIMGDKTDGYDGIKGLGPARAEYAAGKCETIDDVCNLYIKKGYSEQDFAEVYNQARILGKKEIGTNKFELYGGELWTVPTE